MSIPGFSSTGSKRPEALFGDTPDASLPRRMVSAAGARVRDEEGREYLDFIMALGAVALGYADPTVEAAVRDALRDGVVGPLPPVHEERLAGTLSRAIPWMEQVRFLKTGAEAVAAAVRLARAHTGREAVLTCGYHGWLDWCQPGAAGVPASVGGLIGILAFNDAGAASDLIRQRGDALAAVVVEPVVNQEPRREWLETLRRETDRSGAVLIFDEIKTAFRLAVGGAAERYGVHPDLMVLGKALANGFPLAAVGGRRDIMAAATRTWISSTLATEFVALAAAQATIEVMTARDVPAALGRTGRLLLDGLNGLAQEHAPAVAVRGVPEMCFLEFTDEHASSRFAAACARDGVLFKRSAYNFVSLAHQPADIATALQAVEAALAREA